MEGIRTFLESSTIHGLSYISTSHKYARFFWLLVVALGFIGCALLINESFKSWEESPVKTSIETLQISKIKLPKLTVCPPKNTFTDLNSDLLMLKNSTLTMEQRDEIYKNAIKIIETDLLSLTKFSCLNISDQFYNWYHGYSDIKTPTVNKFSGITYWIHTSALSGVITTDHFGQKFKSELIEEKFIYKVSIYPPEITKDNNNVTIHLNLEKLSITGIKWLEKEWNYFYMSGSGSIDDDKVSIYKNFTPPISKYGTDNRGIDKRRYSKASEIVPLKMEMMPGFRFSWWYTGENLEPEPKFLDGSITKLFIRYQKFFKRSRQ